MPMPPAPSSFLLGSHLHLPVVCCGFIKLIAQLEGELGGLERALGCDAHAVAIGPDADGRLL